MLENLNQDKKLRGGYYDIKNKINCLGIFKGVGRISLRKIPQIWTRNVVLK